MKTLFEKNEKLFTSEGFNDLQNAVDEKQLLYLYAFYHYYYGDNEDAFEVHERCDYDASSQNYMQGFFDNEQYDKKCLDILVPYYINEGETFDINVVKYRINQVQSKIAQMKNHFFADQSKILDYWDPKSKDKLNIKVLTNFVPNFDEKNDIRTKLENIDLLAGNMECEIVFGDDIADEVTQTVSDKKYVDEGIFELDEENNFLTYGPEKSLITNIKAKSLKENYKKYAKSGLLAMNLRFYVSTNKNVDEGITSSIRKHGDEFWYLNNGVIAVCDDYEIVDGKYLKLKNFSIVNGGQTTHLVGTIPFDDDFAISCKVIKQKYNNPDDNVEFISRVAEASNSQKPIKSIDIIANKVEQRKLKSKLAENGIFMQVKRGEAAVGELKAQYPEAWQRTKNDELAQIIYSAIYQNPGIARSSKNSLFTNFSKYNEIFGPDYHPELIKDLLILKTAYKNWAKEVIQDEDRNDAVELGLVKNGMYFMLSSVMLAIKLKLSQELVDELKRGDILSTASQTLYSSLTFNHKIFRGSYELVEPNLFNIFDLVLSRYIRKQYELMKSSKPDIAYSNFTKTDKNYSVCIAPEIFDAFSFENSNKLTELLDGILHKEDPYETADSKTWIQLAVANSKADNSKSKKLSLSDELLKDKLNKYKDLIKQTTGKTPFSAVEAAALAKQKPVERNDLYGCFSKRAKTKVRLYGPDILKIIKEFIEENK